MNQHRCNISLTNFIDFSASQSTGQLTQVKIALDQQKRGYNPAQDFYKRIREGIQDFHRAGQEDKNELELIVNSQTDQKKRTAYPLVLAGYQKFLGRKSFQWFDPPREVYSPTKRTVLQ